MKRLSPGLMPHTFELLGLRPVQGTWRAIEGGHYASCNGLAAHYARECVRGGRTVGYSLGDFECLHRPHLAVASALGLSLRYTLAFDRGWDDFPDRWAEHGDPQEQSGYRDGWESARLMLGDQGTEIPQYPIDFAIGAL